METSTHREITDTPWECCGLPPVPVFPITISEAVPVSRKSTGKNPELNAAYSDAIKTDKESRYVQIFESTKVQETRNDYQWY